MSEIDYLIYFDSAEKLKELIKKRIKVCNEKIIKLQKKLDLLEKENTVIIDNKPSNGNAIEFFYYEKEYKKLYRTYQYNHYDCTEVKCEVINIKELEYLKTSYEKSIKEYEFLIENFKYIISHNTVNGLGKSYNLIKTIDNSSRRIKNVFNFYNFLNIPEETMAFVKREYGKGYNSTKKGIIEEYLYIKPIPEYKENWIYVNHCYMDGYLFDIKEIDEEFTGFSKIGKYDNALIEFYKEQFKEG